MNGTYPERNEHIRDLIGQLRQEIPGTMGGFSRLHKAAVAEGTLSTKNKELIALGISIAVLCDSCIAIHVHDALQAGASREEIIETIGVAVLMGGGAALMFGCEAYEALGQFGDEALAQKD